MKNIFLFSLRNLKALCIITLFSISIISCGNNNGFESIDQIQQIIADDNTDNNKEPSENENPPENVDGPTLPAQPALPVENNPLPQQALDNICYPGKDQSICLQLIQKENFVDNHNLYNYQDPQKDKNFPFPELKEHYKIPQFFMDMKNVNLSQNVSPNFKFDEIFRISEQRGYYTLLSRAMIDIFQELRNELQQAIIITSGYRSPGFNSTLEGSASWSRHTYGDAFDFYSSQVSLNELASRCRKKGAFYVSIYSSHVHCDWRALPPDSSFFKSAGEYDKILKEYQKKQKLLMVDLNKMSSLKKHISIDKDQNMQQVFKLVTYQEDPGQLFLKWQIYQNGKLKTEVDAPELPAPTEKGKYIIRVLVSDGRVLDFKFEVK